MLVFPGREIPALANLQGRSGIIPFTLLEKNKERLLIL